MAGTLCAGLNLVFQYVSTDLLGLHYTISVALSFLLINYVGFHLNRIFTFEDRSACIARQAVRYYLVMAGSLTANIVLMVLLVDGVGVHYLIAATGVTILFLGLNLAGHRHITFAPNRP